MVCYFDVAYFDCFLHIPNDNKFRGKKYLYSPQEKTGENGVLEGRLVSNKNPGVWARVNLFVSRTAKAAASAGGVR